MGQQPVVAHPDPQAQSDPIETKRGQKCRPGKEKKCSDGTQMHNAKYDCRDPVDTGPPEDGSILRTHSNISQLNFFPNLREQPNRGLYEGPE